MSDSWRPDGYPSPAFRVQRQVFGVETGGDYVRGSTVSTLPQTALRYPSQIPGFDAATNKAFLSLRPFDHETAEIGWGWPQGISSTWQEVALVRSGFGTPTTVNDGQTVFRALKTDFTDNTGTIDTPPPLVYDTPLTPGRFYYYALFFRTGVLDWIIGMEGQVLIPKDYGHDQHLWNGIPPFYQFTDQNQRVGAGFLQRMLTVFGFELDTAREYVEQWQNLYYIDKTPWPLLRKLGENLGVPYRSAVGQIRYRSLMAGLPEMLQDRGTPQALQQVVRAGSKYGAEITQGSNLMLLPDDSDFFQGTGSWGPIMTSVDTAEAGFANSAGAVNVNLDFEAGAPPAGRGAMITRTTLATETSAYWITAGGSQDPTEGTNRLPAYTGVPVAPGGLYGFSCQVKAEQSSVMVVAMIMWFDSTIGSAGYLGASTTVPAAPGSTNWVPYLVQGTAPAGAVYACPALHFSGRTAGGSGLWSRTVRVAAAMVYRLGDEGNVSVTPPDAFITLGDAGENLGDTDIVLGSSS